MRTLKTLQSDVNDSVIYTTTSLKISFSVMCYYVIYLRFRWVYSFYMDSEYPIFFSYVDTFSLLNKNNEIFDFNLHICF